jgi:hypothetical protein
MNSDSRYMAFAALAIVVLLGVVGVLAGSRVFWVAFTVLHIGVCFYITIQVYYLGRWRLGNQKTESIRLQIKLFGV